MGHAHQFRQTIPPSDNDEEEEDDMKKVEQDILASIETAHRQELQVVDLKKTNGAIEARVLEVSRERATTKDVVTSSWLPSSRLWWSWKPRGQYTQPLERVPTLPWWSLTAGCVKQHRRQG
jgi:hypothetical protein